MAIIHDPKETSHLAGENTRRAGWVTQGFRGDVHGDVLRRVNRKPLGGDGKPTVTTEGSVITVVMPNHSTYRLTLGERDVPLAVPVKAVQKDLPKGAVVPETVTEADVKTWEYSAPPETPKATTPAPAVPDRR